MTLAQQWRHLNVTRNSFCILFPAKGIMSSRQIISSGLYVRLKELVHSLEEHFETPLKKLNDISVFFSILPKKHCRPHKLVSRAKCGPRV